jgi:hypothetical protein
VMVFAASLPGTAVLVTDWARRTWSAPRLGPPLPGGPRILAPRDGAPDV